jgi:hypothetical protein
MDKKETIKKIVKVSGAIVRTFIGIGAATVVFLGLRKRRQKS